MCEYGQSYASAASTMGTSCEVPIAGSKGSTLHVLCWTPSKTKQCFPSTTMFAWLSSSERDSGSDSSATGAEDTLARMCLFGSPLPSTTEAKGRAFHARFLFKILLTAWAAAAYCSSEGVVVAEVVGVAEVAAAMHALRSSTLGPSSSSSFTFASRALILD